MCLLWFRTTLGSEIQAKKIDGNKNSPQVMGYFGIFE
jgi:hypothetical protein